MNSPPVQRAVSDRPPEENTFLEWLKKTVHPVLKGTRDLANALSQNTVQTLTTSGTLDPGTDLALVNAAAGPVTVALATPRLWERRVLVVKTDATANAVTVTGSVIPLSITGQYGVVEVSSDGIQYYPLSTSALAGDVTGPATANIVSKLQNILLTIGTPNTGDVLMYDGTQITPTPQKMRVPDTRYSPVGLWNMNLGAGVGIKDYSGNGNDMVIETGTGRYSGLAPSLGGLLFDGSTNAYIAAPVAILQLLAAMSTVWIGMFSDLPAGGNVRTVLSYSGVGETSDVNYLYRAGIDSSNQLQYFSEHGAGVDDVAQNNTFAPRGQIGMFALTRSAGGVLNFYYNGTVVGASFGTVTLPTDGVNGLVRIGGGAGGAAERYSGVLASVGLYAAELTPANLLDLYNYCLGREFGFR